MRRRTDIDTLTAFDTAVTRAQASGRAPRLVVQSLDLRERSEALTSIDVSEVLLLGCTLAPTAEETLAARGALVFPAFPEVPFDPYRGELYTAQELFGDGAYRDAEDARVYAWSRSKGPRTAPGALAAALHDHAVMAALDEALATVARTAVVGVMGGHALLRGDTDYRAAAALGRTLARAGKTVLTGGGPGAMEAANLGAAFADRPDAALDHAIDRLATVPSFRPSVDAWAAVAREVLADADVPNDRSIGIPTWFYGHEPPNAFSGRIAKFFANPIREATLLERCGGGIVFLPGAAGTVQEIFADACENYYAEPADIAPMVLVDREAWTEALPAWQLLTALATDRAMAPHIALVDDPEQAAARLLPA